MSVARYRRGFPHVKVAVFWALSIALFAVSLPAQKGGAGGGTGGSHGTPGGAGSSRPFPPPMQPVPLPYPNPEAEPGVFLPMPDPPIKPAMVPSVQDDACLPWDLPSISSTTVSAVRLAVPGKARSQFEKACGDFQKSKMSDAEQHARDAIQKYSNYSAAWVLLGKALESQQKLDQAHDACSQPIKADPTYLPPYLCLAGLLNRERKWNDLLTWSDRFQGMNLAADLYSDYFRSLALFHLSQLPEAQKSAQAAIALDTAHHQPGLNFLSAQIYGAQRDLAGATAQVEQFVKYARNQEERDSAKEYLSELKSQLSAK